ncbi:MAG: hypothetical protein HN337_02805 [Deltaproteobacteria bacterium]|jgi:hypothetical protein|nr:hypothetical protein [Deltaproteobacteria bacterium]
MLRKVSVLLAMIVFLLTAATADAGYAMKLRKYTEHGRIYSVKNFDAKLVWHVTFFSDDFRKAFEEKHVKLHHMEDQMEISQYLAEQEHEQRAGWDFFVGFYTKQEYKQFSSESDSFWKIHLTTGSGEVIKPIAMEMIPIGPYEKKMFPYLNRWSKAYRITFPKVDLGDKVTLTARSVAGKSVLKWKLKK